MIDYLHGYGGRRGFLHLSPRAVLLRDGAGETVLTHRPSRLGRIFVTRVWSVCEWQADGGAVEERAA